MKQWGAPHSLPFKHRRYNEETMCHVCKKQLKFTIFPLHLFFAVKLSSAFVDEAEESIINMLSSF